MSTLQAPATSDTVTSGTKPRMTWGWVLKRSALLVLILAAGITCALWLYATASPETDGASSVQASERSV